MNKKILSKLFFGASLLLFVVCLKDEATDGNALPEGQYPLQIASVTMSVESSEQPWTRVSDNTDGNSSTWDGGEVTNVQISGTLSGGTPYSDVGQYEVNADKKNVTVKGKAAYWHSKNNADITAWYASPTDEGGIVNLANQQSGLAYVLQATSSNVIFGTSPSLNFNHQLAKVRIVLDGDQATQVDQLAVYGYTVCTNDKGTLGVDDMPQGWVNMKQTTCTDNSKCWEANVVPGDGRYRWRTKKWL